jgi:hypothetical protein
MNPYFIAANIRRENKRTKKSQEKPSKSRGVHPFHPSPLASPPDFQFPTLQTPRKERNKRKENGIKGGPHSRTTTLLNQSSQSLKLIRPCIPKVPSHTLSCHGYKHPHKATSQHLPKRRRNVRGRGYSFLSITHGSPAEGRLRSSILDRNARISSLHEKANVRSEGSFRSVGVLDELCLFGLVFRYQGTTFLVFGSNVIGTHS